LLLTGSNAADRTSTRSQGGLTMSIEFWIEVLVLVMRLVAAGQAG
jgi:hypothetical protein